MLQADEIDRLLAEYRETGDRRARNRVVEQHLDVADFLVRRLARGDGTLADDLRQVALLGVVQAAERYRPGHGASFRTFAMRTVEGEMKRHLRDRTWNVRPPRSRQDHYLRVCRVREELTNGLRRDPTPAEIAERADLTVDEVLQALDAGRARTGEPLEVTRPDDDRPVLRAQLVFTEAALADSESDIDLGRAFPVLDRRERTVLHLRYVEEMSQPDIGDRLGLSQSYVSRLIRGALEKLRTEMGEHDAPADTGVQ